MSSCRQGRKRVIYQSESVLVGPSPADAYHLEVSGTGVGLISELNTTYAGADVDNKILQLHRVQSVSTALNVARTDVNQFGQLAAIDRIITESPTVSLDMQYLLTNGINEKRLGFYISGDKSALSTILSGTNDEKNYFILTAPEGSDAVQNKDVANQAVIGIGNGFLSNYSLEAAVGGIPTASVTVEALNFAVNLGSSGNNIPAIDACEGLKVTGRQYAIPTLVSGEGDMPTALLPGDITLTLDTAFGAKVTGSGAACIQNVNLSVPIAREPIQCLGSRFAFTREITFPVTVTLSASANVSELISGNLADILCEDEDYDLSIKFNRPNCTGVGETAFIASLKKAKLDSQSFNSSIGANKTVDLSWSAQIGGPEQVDAGLFMSGTHFGA